MKQCSKCGEYVDYFYKNTTANWCTPCFSAYQREYHRSRKDKKYLADRRKACRKHYSSNRDALAERSRKKYHADPSVARAYAKHYREVSAVFKLACKTRNTINKVLADHTNRFSQDTISKLGYTPAELRRHIESLFEDWMSWENRRDWHIDHILPIGYFNAENARSKEFRDCWALSNLRPISPKANMRKGNTIPGTDAAAAKYLSIARKCGTLQTTQSCSTSVSAGISTV